MFGNSRINELKRRLSKLEINNVSYPQNLNIQVTEQRATTDDAIRLANEMRDKVLDDILYLERPKNNTFDYLFAIYRESYYRVKARLIAIINGKEYKAEELVGELFKQELIQEDCLNGGQILKSKYSKEELNILRMQMLAKLLVEAMYDKNNKEFEDIINKLEEF